MKTVTIVFATFFVAAALMSGCANNDSRPSSSSSSYSNTSYGVIEAIETVRGGSDGVGAGAVIGGIVGGVLGRQVGGGTGQDVATVAGVVGGAVAGHQIEKSNKQQQQDTYRIRVRLENGDSRTVTQQSITDLRVGNRVRVVNNHVSRY